jgi:hypothetical protein
MVENCQTARPKLSVQEQDQVYKNKNIVIHMPLKGTYLYLNDNLLHLKVLPLLISLMTCKIKQ